jgi:transcription antitermination factor NusG
MSALANAHTGLDGRNWFAVETRPRHEKKVSIGLREKGIDIFLPLFSEKHHWSDRRQIVEMPVFPRYVFVRIEPTTSARIPVLRTGGVMSFVGNRGIGSAIPDAQIESVMSVISQGVSFSHYAFLEIGERVRIRGGALDGVEGILTAINGDRSLVVSVEMICRSLAIRVDGYRVERSSPSQSACATTKCLTSHGSMLAAPTT